MKKIELCQKVVDSAIWASRWKGNAETGIACGTGMLTGGVLVEVLNVITKTNSKFTHGVAMTAMVEGAFMTLMGILDRHNYKVECKRHNQYFDMYMNNEYEPDN